MSKEWNFFFLECTNQGNPEWGKRKGEEGYNLAPSFPFAGNSFRPKELTEVKALVLGPQQAGDSGGK